MAEHPSDRESLADDLRRVGAILESVAARFAPDSDEAVAIRDAALAYHMIRMHKALRESYEKLTCDGRITDEDLEKVNAHLRRIGIDPDELDDDW